jgi:HSP20 family molecular chaperone IbpA
MNAYPVLFSNGTLLKDFFGDVDRHFNKMLADRQPGKVPATMPLDLQEFADRFELRFDELTTEGNTLSVLFTEEKKEEQQSEGRYLVRERKVRASKRTIEFPCDISQDIQATLKDGVLAIVVRKDESKMPKKISIS